MLEITDDELDQIEEEAADYGLEQYPIEGARLVAIISRLRGCEEYIDCLEDALSHRKSEATQKRNALRMLAALLALFLLAGVATLLG